MPRAVSAAEYGILRDNARPVRVNNISTDRRSVAERKRIFLELLYEFGGLYIALEKGRISKTFIEEQLDADKVFREQVEIGLKKGLEKGLIHAVRIIGDLEVAPSQKGATANLLREILKAARDLYPWLFPEEKREEPGQTYNTVVFVLPGGKRQTMKELSGGNGDQG